MTDAGVPSEATPPRLTIIRVFEAPRELVFQAWTEPARFAQWFGGEGSTIPLDTLAMDVRPGGQWRATMLFGPERRVIDWHGVFLEVQPPERLVLTFSDQPGDEAEVVTVTLTDLGGRTQMVFQQGGHLTDADYAQAGQGWQSFFEQMTERFWPASSVRSHGHTTIVGQMLTVERLLAAPRDLVFRVWTEPEHLAQWWGPTGWTLPYSRLDLRPGGAWHYCLRGPNGAQSWGLATYQEVVPPERLVYTDAFSDEAGNIHPSLPVMSITLEFTELDGQTKVTSRTVFASPADLERILKMGAIAGLTQTWDRLEAYVADLAAGEDAGREMTP
jgi:uncharacterized protein YndB with AHSA1/START domain